MAQQVTLPDEWVEFVEQPVRDGGYADSSEVVPAELAAREAEDFAVDMTTEELAELRQDIDAADAEIARGELVSFDRSAAGREENAAFVT